MSAEGPWYYFPAAGPYCIAVKGESRPAASWPSRRRFVSNSANTPSISRKHLPAALLVSMGWSEALSEAPFARTARTMRAGRSG